ncbi:MAG: triple tyrosine motif-containing protein [Bacteroidales bacterium]|nr:triple tyrosine motif-containing protein [Bacteroidales bacterium]
MKTPLRDSVLRMAKPVLGIFMLFICARTDGQLPLHVTSYEKGAYGGGNQNWAIDLDGTGNLFVANSNGLLILRGSSFSLYKMPLETPVRSVRYIAGRIYTGSFEDFGYWEPVHSGGLEYHSLAGMLSQGDLKNEEIWRIQPHGDAIFFQSFGKLFCYQDSLVEEISLPGSVLFLIKCDNRLFIQENDGGLFELQGHQLSFLEGSEIFQDTEVKAILPYREGKIIIGTSSKGLFVYDGKSWTPMPTNAEADIRENKINNGVRVGDAMVFGTIMKGLYVFDLEGRLLEHLHAGNLLKDNTVLALRGDPDNNLWVGLDKGLDYITFQSPIDLYVGLEPGLGTVYTAALYKGVLYIGTNQGIHYLTAGTDGRYGNLRLIPGSQGQVWFIKEIEGDLYCGLNEGTFLIREGGLVPVSLVSGGYNLKPAYGAKEDFLVQSTYYPLLVYKKEGGAWREHHVLEGFEGPARFLEMDYLGGIWLGHSLAGIYRLQPDQDMKTSPPAIKIDTSFGLNSPTNRVFKLDNRIVILTGETLLQWDAVNHSLVPFQEIIPELEGFEKSNMIVQAGANRYWFFKKNEAGLFEISYGNARLLYRLLPEMYGLELVENYENIVALNDSLHVVCLSNGFALFNLERLDGFPAKGQSPEIRNFVGWKNPDKTLQLPSNQPGVLKMKRGYNNLRFEFFVPGPVGKNKYFQYRLLGIDEEWSDWTQASGVSFQRLSAGNYTFQVRALGKKGLITEPRVLTFRVRSPWYANFYSFTLYALALLGIFWFIRLRYLKQFYRKREEVLKEEQRQIIREKEHAESELIRLSNEKLQSEISMKNSQLANSTMSIIRKNELLGEIQGELNHLREEVGGRFPKKYFSRINRLIEGNFKSDHDWELFEKLFDQAHENFFQRLKASSPELTSGDLRLCAYLRLNLSSKEIAPLLNISVRGVEERRYRLRKRIGLPPEQNLSEFILSF